MITNERQYKITRAQLAQLKRAIANFQLSEKVEQIGSELLASAELDALKSEVEVLEKQIQDYESLKTGAEIPLPTKDLRELPHLLIQSRISQNLSQRELANLLKLKEQQIQRYEAEEYQSANLKRLLEVAEALMLSVSEITETKGASKKYTDKVSLDWSKFPIKEMYKRGWFEGFSDSLEAASKGSKELLESYLAQVNKKPVFGFHRKHVRTNASLDEYALLAWECRVLHLARKIPVNTYSKDEINSKWVSSLVQLSKFPDGPRKAQKMLEEAGIILVIEPALRNTYLDGAALLMGETPIIGLTLRYDRLDNFWFVLLHEIFHVSRHLRKNKIDRIFDDLDYSDSESIESEADELASEALIPISEWNKAIARFTRSARSVNELANRLGISSSIIAGRIRHEADNYTILGDLIGQGQVRNQFPDIQYGI